MTNRKDSSTRNKRKRYVEGEIRKLINLMGSVSEELDTYLEGPSGDRRVTAILNYLDRVEEELRPFSVRPVVEMFSRLEIYPLNEYHRLDCEGDVRVGAALWMLDRLRAAGKLHEACTKLPDVSGEMDAWYLPSDFYHPCYSDDLINSAVYVITNRYDDLDLDQEEDTPEKRKRRFGAIITEENTAGKRPEGLYAELVKLIPQEEVEKACEKFRNKVWELVTIRIKARGSFDRQIEGFYMRASSNSSKLNSYLSGVNMAGRKSSEQLRQEVADVIHNLSENDASIEAVLMAKDIEKKGVAFNGKFDEYLLLDRRTLRKETGSREVTDILNSFTVENPYEMCFALFWLLDTGDDAPWLFQSGASLIRYCLHMLPWYADMEDWSDEEIDAWYTSLPYNYNGWLNREPVVDQIDFYHEKHGEKNLARVIYELCRCVVPVDLHPFETDREQLVAEGMDEAKARKITETADLLFLANHQACLWKKPDYSWLLEDEAGEDTDEESDSEGKGRSGSPRDGVSNTNYGTESENFPEQDGPDLAEENESLRGELSSLKSQLKSLKSVLAQTKQESNNERAKYEHELKSLRMEHRELADLRELVFNRESDQPERLEKVQRQYSYPYETRKRTVVFGGHDSFLRAFRPMFTNVRFVDAGNMAYSPDIIRNADVVWIQNNCISHPQYWSIVKNCKQAGVQLRYFGFASAEKCAEQLVTEDQKG